MTRNAVGSLRSSAGRWWIKGRMPISSNNRRTIDFRYNSLRVFVCCVVLCDCAFVVIVCDHHHMCVLCLCCDCLFRLFTVRLLYYIQLLGDPNSFPHLLQRSNVCYNVCRRDETATCVARPPLDLSPGPLPWTSSSVMCKFVYIALSKQCYYNVSGAFRFRFNKD